VKEDGPNAGQVIYLDRQQWNDCGAGKYMKSWDIVRSGDANSHIKIPMSCCSVNPEPQTVTGTVTNALSGNGEEGVTVTISSGNVVRTGVTDAGGSFSLEAPPGPATVQYFKVNFINTTTPFTISSSEPTKIHGSMSPSMPPNDWRFVLEWDKPHDGKHDLDSHTMFSTCTNVYWHHRTSTCGGMTVKMDRDDTEGNEPETTTIHDVDKCDTSCKVVFKVKDFSASTSSVDTGNFSTASVSIMNGAYSIRAFNVSEGVTQGTFWSVFYLNTKTGELKPCTKSDCP
jgi:stress response protein SCP2